MTSALSVVEPVLDAQAVALEEMLRSLLLKKERRFGKADIATMRAASSLAECLCKQGQYADAGLIVAQLDARIVSHQTMLAQQDTEDEARNRDVAWWDADATLLTASLRITIARRAAVNHDVIRSLAGRLFAIKTELNHCNPCVGN